MTLNEVLPCTCFTAEIAVLVIKFPGQKEKIHDRIVISRPRSIVSKPLLSLFDMFPRSVC